MGLESKLLFLLGQLVVLWMEERILRNETNIRKELQFPIGRKKSKISRRKGELKPY